MDCSWTPIDDWMSRGSGHTGRPSTETSPPSGLRSPSIISSVVVLPAPLGPRMPNDSPFLTSKLTASTATWSPYRLVSPLTVMASSPAMRGRMIVTPRRSYHLQMWERLTGAAQAGRFGTSTLRRNSQTTSPRWFVPMVSTVTTPRSGLLFDSTLSSTVVCA